MWKNIAFSLFFVPAMLAWQPLAHAKIFSSGETHHADLSYFPKWTGMLERSEAGQIGQSDQQIRGSGCIPNPRFPCAQELWDRFVAETQSATLEGVTLLNAVNQHLNQARYVLDPVNWGVPDYWAHLGEFIDRNGDCEDYAISKYATLKRLGIPAENMRVLVLEDLNLDLAHAILMVELEGEIYVLDNQVPSVLPHGNIHHYRPVYSLNEQGWWMHHSPQ